MGLLVNGKWEDTWYDTKSNQGHFKRSEAQFRQWLVSPDKIQDPSTEFLAESGRYHLYVSLACPWAHRTLIMRHLKGLEDHISVSCVHPHMLEHGWTFDTSPKFQNGIWQIGDPHYGYDYAYQLYTHADKNYSGRVTVPILWDTKRETIVSNESAEIIRMFNSEFNTLTKNDQDYYPIDMHDQINEINDFVYHNVNNGVYKAGFATSQAAYEASVTQLFDALETLEERLEKQDFLVGNQLSEADIRLFTTLIRFDPVYVGHFKCNLKRIADYPNLSSYMSRIFHTEQIAKTCNLDHIKQHYYFSHATINPTRVVPSGPTGLLFTT